MQEMASSVQAVNAAGAVTDMKLDIHAMSVLPANKDHMPALTKQKSDDKQVT